MKLGKRLAALMMALVLAVGVLAGCGKQDEVHLRVCLETIPKTLDPAMVTSDEARTVVSHLFENLMKLQSNGSSGGVGDGPKLPCGAEHRRHGDLYLYAAVQCPVV